MWQSNLYSIKGNFPNVYTYPNAAILLRAHKYVYVLVLQNQLHFQEQQKQPDYIRLYSILRSIVAENKHFLYHICICSTM